MVKGGKKHFSVNNGGKWFSQPGSSVGESSTSPEVPLIQRYPKWRDMEKSREFPFSGHDNKYSLRGSIDVFSQEVGRRRCPDNRRQHNSHLRIGHEGSDVIAENGPSSTIYQDDFVEKTGMDVPTASRRFPRNHRMKSAQAKKETFMWFGQVASSPSDSGSAEMKATELNLPKPWPELKRTSGSF